VRENRGGRTAPSAFSRRAGGALRRFVKPPPLVSGGGVVVMDVFISNVALC